MDTNNVLLMWAAAKGELTLVKLLLQETDIRDVDARDREGWTALMCAARTGNLEIVKYLIEKGANVNAKNNDGETALDLAGVNGHTAVAEFLCEHGAKKGCDL